MILNWFKRKKSEKQFNFDGLRKEIDSWKMGKASKFVNDVLADKTKYKVVENKSGNEELVELPNQSTKSFFKLYESCSQVYGDVSISLSEVGPSEYRPEYIRVARGPDSIEIVIKKGNDAAYEIDGSEYDFKEKPFPSIYHWLAFSSCVVYQELQNQAKSEQQQ